jgi:tetratricopeptide (TPR) repeat protein
MQRVLTISTLALAMMLPALCADQKPPMVKSKGEAEAYNAIMAAPDPDARIKASDAFITKYADSELKGQVLFAEAYSYQQKGEYEKMAVYLEQTIAADPKHYGAMLMLAKSIAQRTREFDLDREEKLAHAEKYAKEGMDLVKDAPKPNPQASDEQWADAKKEYMSQGHSALGYAARARKNYEVAITEMKQAISEAPDPVTMVQLAAVYDLTKKPDEALPLLDKVIAMPDLHPSIRQFAQAEKVRATQMKSGGKNPGAPAAPPAPAQVEIKKQ